jgi:hypothetical protein
MGNKDKGHESTGLKASPQHGPPMGQPCSDKDKPAQSGRRSEEPRQERQSAKSADGTDVVKEASEESFPASDPPAWIRHTT